MKDDFLADDAQPASGIPDPFASPKPIPPTEGQGDAEPEQDHTGKGGSYRNENGVAVLIERTQET